MCRISGIIAANNSRENIYMDVKSMCNSLSHGGPDDEGMYLADHGRLCFGHRRLSLLDLSPLGHQPMADSQQRYWLVFNGEIYNFLELKNQLISKGHTFKSTSDTEVILAAYEQWGTESFKLFNGMFAFALYDSEKQEVFLVRDSAGIKPLYYHIDAEGELIFASEVKAFMEVDSNWEQNPDWRLLLLCFGHIPEPYTTLKGVQSLVKGTYLQFDLNAKRVKNIVQFRELGFKEIKIKDKKEAIKLIQEKLRAAVERHLISDAPIGLFLSGGIDSSLLTLIAAERVKDQLHTLSVTFAEESFSEQEYQQAVISQINCKHNYCSIGKTDLESNLNTIISAYDQPSNDGINSWFISKCAYDNGLKAVLSGLGSDEVFGGYPSFDRMNTLYKIKNLPASVLALSKYIPSGPLQRISWMQIKEPIGLYLTLRGLCTLEEASKLSGLSRPEVINKLNNLNFSPFQNNLPKEQAASWLEFNMYMQNQLLKDSDYMSMQHALELRVPFLDQEFLDTVFSIDTELLYGHKGIPKQLLIDAFKDIMPEKIWNRKKMGFSFPFQKWFGNIEQLRTGISRTMAGKNLLQSFDQGKTHWSKLWAYYLSENFNI